MRTAGPPTSTRATAIVVVVLLSLLVHLLVLPLAARWFGRLQAPVDAPMNVTFVDADTLDVPSMEALKERARTPPPPQEPTPVARPRQLVETPPPAEEKAPEDADYVAEHDNRVERESRTEKFEVNPEVVAPTYSPESRPDAETGGSSDPTQAEDATPTADASEPLPGPGGPPRTLLPSKWLPARLPGPGTSAGAQAEDAVAIGAPQNDLLDEAIGDSLALNTMALPGARYLNHIRRQVNFYWSRYVDNLSPRLGLSRPVYVTRVRVVLRADGALDGFVVTRPSGSNPVDDCVQRAFAMAAPAFGPAPPEVVSADGLVHLPNFSFTLEMTRLLDR